MALGAPIRAFIRRKKAPKALWLWCRHAAASRRAVAARLAQGLVRRLRTLPPDTRWCWQRPNHDVKCFTVGQATHIQPNLAEDDQGRRLVNALNLGQVYPGDPVQGGA